MNTSDTQDILDGASQSLVVGLQVPIITTQAPLKPHTLLVNHVLQSTQYGDFIDHQTISVITGLNYGDQSYSHAVSKANKELAHHGKILKNVKGQGYEVLVPDGYNGHVTDMMAAACRKMEYAKIVSINAPVSLMSQPNQVKHASIETSVKTISARLIQNVNQVRKSNGQISIQPLV